MNKALQSELRDALETCLLKDRFRFGQRLRKAQPKSLEKLQQDIERSQKKYQQRLTNLITPDYPSLPISDRKAEIIEALSSNQVVVIAGETGSGKTTQLPKICLEMGRGVSGLIGHTQPRRLAARTVAQRIADELKTPLGEGVGFKVRFSDKVGDNTYIKLMTDGILLAEIQNDRFLEQYDTLIIDEAHERSLNIDFILGYLKQLLPKRPDLKVIITSATIDLERFSQHFNGAPIIEVSGRTYPVETLYRPAPDGDDATADLPSQVLSALDEVMGLDKNSRNQASLSGVLVFLSGEKDIREVSNHLRKHGPKDTQILPLYARLSHQEQARIFSSQGGRKVILATNVAETSLTVPGIRYVIDPGMARISRYSYRSKVQRLPIEPISQASANQRKGRCGRVSAGVCVRLYSEDDFESRDPFTDPEISRTNLAAVILQMKQMGLGDIDAFPFVQPPDGRYIRDGLRLLHELQALNEDESLSKLGKQLVKMPVDPKIGRTLVASVQHQCLREILIIASALSVADPRERPFDKREKSEQCHREHYHPDSDFLSFVNLWNHFEGLRQELSQNQLRKYCKQHFLSYNRMLEWRDIHRQLVLATTELGFKANTEPASYEAVHRSLLTGFITHIIQKYEGVEYAATRNRKLLIHPSSGQRKRQPGWAMAAEFIDTNRLYAACVAKIDPLWVLDLAQHLLKYQYFEPHWAKRRGQVMAYRRSVLLGLTVEEKRLVHYGPVNPEESREIFIRECLVNGSTTVPLSFLKTNREHLASVELLESKSRRRDIVIDEEDLIQWYARRLPEGIYQLRSLQAWLKKQPEQERAMTMTADDLLQRNPVEITDQQYPDHWHFEGVELPLSYQFKPGHEDDGVTLTLPLPLLGRIPTQRVQWLVPGMLRDKCIALIKALPKSQRRNYVPAPSYVDAFLQAKPEYATSLYHAFAQHLTRMTGHVIKAEEFATLDLDDVHLMRFALVNGSGETIRASRSLDQLKHNLTGEVVSGSVEQLIDSSPAGAHAKQDTIYQQWPDIDLTGPVRIENFGVYVEQFPALAPTAEQSGVHVSYCDQQWISDEVHWQGVCALLAINMKSESAAIEQAVQKDKTLILHAKILGNGKKIARQIMLASIQTLFASSDHGLSDALPRKKDAFSGFLDQARQSIVGVSLQTQQILSDILSRHHRIQKALKSLPLACAHSHKDIKRQLDRLLCANFLSITPTPWLNQYPRYFQAIELRLEKLSSQQQNDKLASVELEKCHKQWQALEDQSRADKANWFEWNQLGWMIEEYRVSLFAQQLKTRSPVSAKRLDKQLKSLKENCHR